MPYCYERECRKMWNRAPSELSAYLAHLKEALSEFNTTIKHAWVKLSITLAISVSGMLHDVYFLEKCKRHCIYFSPPCSILICCFLPKQFCFTSGEYVNVGSFTLISHNLSTMMYTQKQQNALLFCTYLIVSTAIWVLTKLSFLPKVQKESAICLCGTSLSSIPTLSPSSAGFQIMRVCLRWTTWHLLTVTVTQGKKIK